MHSIGSFRTVLALLSLSLTAVACTAPLEEGSAADDLKQTDYLISSCVASSDFPAQVDVSISTDKAFSAVGATLKSVRVRIGYKLNVDSLQAQVVSSIRGSENGETPGNTTDFGTVYSMKLAPGAQIAGGAKVSKIDINSKGYMDIFKADGSLLRRQELGSCGLKNLKVLDKVMPLAG
jgi:hypothetical protein